jgi:DNA-directed RNA polymerase specialized sigma24 family protein
MNIETLYESYSRDVFRFALYLSGNWEDAEDITADTFEVVTKLVEPSIPQRLLPGKPICRYRS